MTSDSNIAVSCQFKIISQFQVFFLFYTPNYRTQCRTENETIENDREIKFLFPNYAAADFGEFIHEMNLEQNDLKTPLDVGENHEIIGEDDLKFAVDAFISMMFNHTR